MSKIPTIKLNNGVEMPVLGLGTYKSAPNAVTKAVEDAIDAGYRHFDCAFFYENEKEVGDGIQTKIKEGVVQRKDLFICSKLWNNTHSQQSVVPACRKSLELLQTDYVDLYLIHWPVGFKEGDELTPKTEDGKVATSDIDYIETWRGMEECARLGLARAIGVSNFNHEQIERILSIAEIKPTVNQVECNPNINQKKLIQFCNEHDIVVTAYCPLGKAAEARTKPGAPLASMEEPGVIEIAAKYKKTPAQVCLRYLIQHGVVVIPKSITKSRIIENIDCFDFTLDQKEMDYFDTLNKNIRLATFKDCKDHKYFPFNLEY